MMEKKIADWLNTAVSGIRFKPDRAAVERELREHLEDKIEDLQRFYHLSREEAEEMALGQMGDAEEIGREMAKIHKPWLGWLWLATQVATIPLVVLLLLSTVSILLSGESLWSYMEYQLLGWEEQRDVLNNPWRWVDPEDCEGLQVLELNCPEVQAGQYHIQVKQAQLWNYEGVFWRKNDYRVVYVYLRVEQERPWEEPYNLVENLWAEDDRSTIIPSDMENSSKVELGWAPSVYGERLSRRPFSSEYHLIMQDVGLNAKQVELRYDQSGAGFVLPISLERGLA